MSDHYFTLDEIRSQTEAWAQALAVTPLAALPKASEFEQVIFTGERHDVADMLSAMDLFVASSKQETFGLSVLEALANGLPVLKREETAAS